MNWAKRKKLGSRRWVGKLRLRKMRCGDGAEELSEGFGRSCGEEDEQKSEARWQLEMRERARKKLHIDEAGLKY
jgi:hypothetical protein